MQKVLDIYREKIACNLNDNNVSVIDGISGRKIIGPKQCNTKSLQRKLMQTLEINDQTRGILRANYVKVRIL